MLQRGSRNLLPDQRVVQGERRVVTILFCDVKDSTAMAEHLDPEEWAEIMNEAFKYLTEPIHRYGGTVARLMGDGILAFFGAPEAHEDDPQRAVRP
jgi:class 3 adenylate cyclase